MTTKNNTNRFSTLERPQYLKKLQTIEFDLLVIGGGITGAGIALDAATRGLKVALVEKKDFAWGTSSRSTKLIHGGLRYLKNLEFKLVHEVGTERAIVHENARHTVIPERMLLPIIEKGSLSKTMTAWALWIYDWLAGVPNVERKRMLSAKATIEAEPLLRQDILKGGGLYYEYRSDDARLTIEVLKSAVEQGAVCLNYAVVTGFLYDVQGLVIGAQVDDLLGGQSLQLKARKVVNAAGPWVDTLRKLDSEGVKGKRLQLSKGVHIVVPRERLALHQSVYFDVNGDKRMVFAIPRADVTYLGTTDTLYDASIDQPEALQADIDYLLNAANYMFPTADLKPEDVVSTWSGLRPLIYQEGRSMSELSRKDEIFHAKTGLISIAGGKLTGYRKMAEKVVNLVCKELKNKEKCKTKQMRVSGADFDSDEVFDLFINQRIGQSKQIGATPKQIKLLAYRYGANIDLIIQKAFELYPEFSDANLLLHAAELWYVVEYESVASLCDYLIRRSGRLYFERSSLSGLYPFIAREMGKLLGWSESQLQSNLQEFEAEFEGVMKWREVDLKI